MIANPLQMNDWEIKKFVWVVLAVQLAMLGLVGLAALGYDIPVLRQIIGFIYLNFIPGIVILRVLRLHKLGSVETLLYSVGLSLAFNMFLGSLINTLYPLIGISGPISTFPLIITWTLVLGILCFVAYKRDKGFSIPSHLKVGELLSPPALFLILLPLLSILGAQLVNFYQTNVILMALMFLIALVPILIIFTRFIPERFYPLAVVVIALALLFHSSLISSYLIGWDIHLEYHFANLVVANSVWDSTIPHSYNTALSVTMLAPIIADISGMELTWVFKIIYPLIFSLMPLGIYRVTQRQTSSKIAFLAAFFLMSVPVFATTMITTIKQPIAEIFMVLIVLVMISKSMNPLVRSVLYLVFAASLVVSYYGEAFIFAGALPIVLLILFLSQRISARGSAKRVESGSLPTQPSSQGTKSSSIPANRMVTPTFVALYIVFYLSWYMWQASTYTFLALVMLMQGIVSNVFTELVSPQTSQTLWTIISLRPSALHEVNRFLHLFMAFLIAVGILDLLLHWRQKKFDEEYSAFSLVYFTLAAAAIAVPYLDVTLHASRLYHITLLFLAPFGITGAIAIYRVFVRKSHNIAKTPLKVLSLILVLFFLFNTGFIYEITQDHPSSRSLSQEWIKEEGDAKDRVSFYSAITVEREAWGARWLSDKRNSALKVYADGDRYEHVLQSTAMLGREDRALLTPATEIKGSAYIYLGELNTVYGLIPIGRWREKFGWDIYDISEISHLLEKANKIYSNGGSEIYLIRGK